MIIFNTCLNDSRNQFAFLSLILLVRLRKKDKRLVLNALSLSKDIPHVCTDVYRELYVLSLLQGNSSSRMETSVAQ